MLFPYTNEGGFHGILRSQSLWTSLKASAKKDADGKFKDFGFGEAFCAMSRGPDEFDSQEAIVDNNYNLQKHKKEEKK